MSYGIEVINPGINRVILDENNPVYVIPPIRVSGWRRYRGATSWSWSRDDGLLNYEAWQDFDILFKYALTSPTPPLVFIDQKYPSRGGNNVVRFYESSTTGGWLSNIKITPLGTEGAWTGVRVAMYSQERIQSARYNGQRWFEQQADYNIQNFTPNLSSHFIAAGYGVSPDVSGYGLVIWDGSGRVVFSSDANTAKALRASSKWLYIDRSGSSGTYVERWQLDREAPNSNAYVLVTPQQQYRRYNGETAMVGLTDLRGRPRRMIIGGRSGSPAHTPIVWIEPMKPVERW